MPTSVIFYQHYQLTQLHLLKRLFYHQPKQSRISRLFLVESKLISEIVQLLVQ